MDIVVLKNSAVKKVTTRINMQFNYIHLMHVTTQILESLSSHFQCSQRPEYRFSSYED